MKENPPFPEPLVILGGAGLDVLVYPDGHEVRMVGGSAWYASLAAALFHPVTLLAAVGGDFPAEALETLARRGVDLGALMRRPDAKSFFWKARYASDPDQRETLELHPNVELEFDPVWPSTRSQFALLGNCRPALQSRLLDRVPQGTFVALDTIDRWIESCRDELVAMLPRVDLFLINAQEAAMLTGTQTIESAGRAILSMGPRFCLVKDGAAGSHLFGDGSTGRFIPCRAAARVVDATGAGDTFAGALMGFLAKSRPETSPLNSECLLAAAAMGAAVASHKIGAPGAQNLIGDAAAVLGSCGIAL